LVPDGGLVCMAGCTFWVDKCVVLLRWKKHESKIGGCPCQTQLCLIPSEPRVWSKKQDVDNYCFVLARLSRLDEAVGQALHAPTCRYK
jgi:hypothetical protein